VQQFAFPFFACAKKGTKKAQPILMQNISYVEHSSAKIGGEELNYIEHVQLSNKQGGMKSSC